MLQNEGVAQKASNDPHEAFWGSWNWLGLLIAISFSNTALWLCMRMRIELVISVLTYLAEERNAVGVGGLEPNLLQSKKSMVLTPYTRI
jgi:hypothetical protein